MVKWKISRCLIPCLQPNAYTGKCNSTQAKHIPSNLNLLQIVHGQRWFQHKNGKQTANNILPNWSTLSCMQKTLIKIQPHLRADWKHCMSHLIQCFRPVSVSCPLQQITSESIGVSKYCPCLLRSRHQWESETHLTFFLHFPEKSATSLKNAFINHLLQECASVAMSSSSYCYIDSLQRVQAWHKPKK